MKYDPNKVIGEGYLPLHTLGIKDPDDIAFVTTIVIMKPTNGNEFCMEDAQLLRDHIRDLLDVNPDLQYHIITGVVA